MQDKNRYQNVNEYDLLQIFPLFFLKGNNQQLADKPFSEWIPAIAPYLKNVIITINQ